MYQLIFFIHIVTAICIVGLVLVQQGKGASMGAAFGSGASQTVFGSRGTGSFLLKVTIAFAVIFFATSVSLNFMASKAVKQAAVVNLPIPEGKVEQPAMPMSAPATLPNGLLPTDTNGAPASK